VTYQIGQCVRNPKMPDWGVGRIVEVTSEHHVWVVFETVGRKKIDLRHVAFDVVSDSEARSLLDRQHDPLVPLPAIDLEKLRRACEHFIAEMKDNRTGFNDAGVAEEVLAEISEFGSLRRATYKKLAAWCHTNGSVFQRGVSIAQEISITIYGRVIREDD
jgi:hypothetical protein